MEWEHGTTPSATAPVPDLTSPTDSDKCLLIDSCMLHPPGLAGTALTAVKVAASTVTAIRETGLKDSR